jgi:hypothetical protein
VLNSIAHCRGGGLLFSVHKRRGSLVPRKNLKIEDGQNDMRFERKEVVAVLVGESLLVAVFAAFMWKHPAASGYNWWVLIIGSIILFAIIGLLVRLVVSRWNYQTVRFATWALAFVAISAIMKWLWQP